MVILLQTQYFQKHSEEGPRFLGTVAKERGSCLCAWRSEHLFLDCELSLCQREKHFAQISVADVSEGEAGELLWRCSWA